MTDVSGVAQGGPPSWLANLPDAVKRVFGYANPIPAAQAALPTGSDSRLGSSVGINAVQAAPPVLPNVMPTNFGPSQGPPSSADASAYNPPSGISTMAPTIDPSTGLPTSQGFGGGAPQPMPFAGGQGPIAGNNSQAPIAPYAPNTFAGWASPVDGSIRTEGSPAWYGDPRIGTDKVGAGGPGGTPSMTPRPKGGGGRTVTVNPRARAQAPAGGGGFTMVAAPNANPGTGGGMLGGGLARPQISAIDLSKLFSRS
jgi:hypothetical protein